MKKAWSTRISLLIGIFVSFQSFGQSSFSDSDLKKMTKLILNTNGLLCAEVLDIRPLKVRDNVYEVECIEYRGGENKKTYIMDAVKGTAWNP